MHSHLIFIVIPFYFNDIGEIKAWKFSYLGEDKQSRNVTLRAEESAFVLWDAGPTLQLQWMKKKTTSSLTFIEEENCTETSSRFYFLLKIIQRENSQTIARSLLRGGQSPSPTHRIRRKRK